MQSEWKTLLRKVSIPYKRVTNDPLDLPRHDFTSVSIPYKRVTNLRSGRHKTECFQVSIPYKRVTNMHKVGRIGPKYLVFQSPISGSQTNLCLFMKVIEASVSIPYKRVTNELEVSSTRTTRRMFQSPISGSQTMLRDLVDKLAQESFNPL